MEVQVDSSKKNNSTHMSELTLDIVLNSPIDIPIDYY